MAFVDGTILRTEADGAALDAPRGRARATDSLVDVQVALHALDVDAIGLGDLGPAPHGATSSASSAAGRPRSSAPGCASSRCSTTLHDRLAASMPPETGAPALVHGDYRFDNVVLGADQQIVAVLDWELATIGDAVADACWSLLYWADPGDALPFLTSAPTLAPCFSRRAEVAERYARRSGRDLDALGWFTVFGYWKMACIVEGVYARRLQGASGGAGAGSPDDPATIAVRVDQLLDAARDAAAELGWATLT